MGRNISEAIGRGFGPEQAIAVKTDAVATGITAAGSTIADAFQLDTGISIVETAASGTGVLLPNAETGETVVVQNLGANDLEVYPPTSSQAINGAAGGTALTLAAATNVIGVFYKISATTWAAFVVAGPVT